MDYIPEHFKPYELVPKTIFRTVSEKVIWFLFDPRILYVADHIRKRYGKMIANTWYWGGEHQYRGWRPLRCKIGAVYSQHRFGRAIDLVPVEVTVDEIRQDIKRGENFHFISCIEEGVSWLHVDVRNYKGLLIVSS